MKKIVKLLIVATLFVMCFVNIACMGCGTEPAEPNASEIVPSESVSEPATDNQNTTEELSSEEAAYQEWKNIEVSEPSFGEAGANISAGELLERAVVIENFITTYPDSQYREEAVEQYNKLVTAAITGGYVDEENNSHLYLNETGDAISEDVVTEYDTFVNNYGDTQTAAIVQEYTTLIGDAEGSFTNDVKDFYDSLKDRFMGMFGMNGTNTSNGGSATNGGNTTNGGDNDGSNSAVGNEGVNNMQNEGSTNGGNVTSQNAQ